MGASCQSCGMPLKRDPNHGGTNADHSKSTEYCSLCYEDGEFKQPDFTAKDMQVFCIEQITRCGMPKFVAWIFTRRIPKLKRWAAQ